MNKPGQTILIGDAESPDLTPMVDASRWTMFYYPGVDDLLGVRHSGFVNIMWGDGHSAPISYRQTREYGRVNGVAYYYWLLTK